MRNNFLITDKEVSRGKWVLPLLHPISDSDLPELIRGYAEWLLWQSGFYEVSPGWWFVRGQAMEQSDDVYFSSSGQMYGNGALLRDLDALECWLAAQAA